MMTKHQIKNLSTSLWLGLYMSALAVASNQSSCQSGVHKYDPFNHKKVYHIGVHAIRGFEAAFNEYNRTFSTYLTETAGKRFDPPIEFEMVPHTFESIFTAIDNEELDFLYANPSIYSCIGVEVGASPLVTIVSRLEVRGQVFDLDVFGGVMATRADNNEISTIHDFKDKIIGAGAISMVMAGQLQFYEMGKAGLSYVNDPKQVVLTGNQFDVVHGVLDGTYDVGFVRTDTIERTTDASGDLIDPDLFKVIKPEIYVMDDGSLFPFLHSTDIYPEWPVAALTNVPKDVAIEVQEALLAIGDHARLGEKLEACVEGTALNDYCEDKNFPYDFDLNARCDTTKPVAKLALEASRVGKFAGFRTSRSYFEVRSMQQDAGFLMQDEDGDWHCTRPSSLYDSIVCPEGHFKRTQEEFEGGCSQVGLTCEEGYDCFCRPCVKAFEVDVYEHVEGTEDYHLMDYYGEELRGCDKMKICGTVQQGQTITLRIFDNRQRDNAVVTVLLHAGDDRRELPVTNIEGTHAYEFQITEKRVQVQVVEIFVNGEQIPQSPIRVMVENLDCDALSSKSTNREADANGQCICANNTYEILGECLESIYFFLIIFTAVIIFMLILVLFYLRYRKKQSDSVWHVSVDELHFNEPPEVIGQGAFGVVVLGQYRGTKVAVKRVLPPVKKSKSKADPNGSTSDIRSIESGSKVSNKAKKHTKTGNDSVEQSGDIEAPLPVRSRNSISMPDVSWDDMFRPQKFDSIIKILESATLSSHDGSASFDAYGRESSSRFGRLFPLWLRFDEHSRLRKEFITEMRLLSRLRHPCITTVMGAVIDSHADPMLVMEFMDHGSLHDLLHNETMYTGGEIILQIIRDVVQGIQFLHASKPPILHGDLKAKNILVDSRFRAKVADFGFSHIKKQEKTQVLKGTPFYMAPEYLRRKSEYNSACDIYSLSMIFYEMYARQSPFEGEDPRKVLPKICHPRINKRPAIPEACPPKMTEIMKKCWASNPFFRPSAKDLDYILVEMNSRDAEPLETKESKAKKFKQNRKLKTTSLYDVFPKHIADSLNAGQKVEPESHEIVTVVFSDIVGFTDISQTFSPLKVSDMLDRLYVAFDELANKHNIFKVETIGDAYMGVTNLEGNQFDCHVKNIANFALDAIKAASHILIDQEAPERGCVQIRVGFHSGPVVSNVIGSLNPRYGLFGDTVNTASRMESNSLAGRVQCTYASAHILEQQAPELPINPRGKIQIKGKGKMSTYWVGKAAHLPALDIPPARVFHPQTTTIQMDGSVSTKEVSSDDETAPH